MQLPAGPRGGAHARARAPADLRHTKLIQKILKNPEDNKFIPVIG
jgi:hypothetical protein